MNDGLSQVQIRVRELPSMESFELSTGTMPVDEAIDYLKYEFDSEIDLIIGGKNVLTGYERPLAYPAFAFVANMTSGLSELLNAGKASIPIYIMQGAVSGPNPHHVLDLAALANDARVAAVSFYWTTASVPVRRGLPEVKGELVPVGQLADEILNTARTYKERLDFLALQLGIAPSTFADLRYEELLHARKSYFA
jgi:hypothetical protein